MLFGVCSAFGASFLFGSVFVPIKRVRTRDGFFAQLMMCLGALTTGVLISAIENFPPIYPVAMIGGVIWCIANAFAIKIMSILGMALGVLIWNTTSCLTGWAVARFGLFGIRAMHPASNLLNGAGVVLLIIGGVIYLFIKSDLSEEEEEKEKEDIECVKKIEDEEEQVFDSSFKTRFIAIGAALVSGMCYGLMSTPITFIQQNPSLFPHAPSSGLPYVFSFLCGVIITSVVIYAIYSIRSNAPYVHSSIVVPGMMCGAIFASAIAMFFIAIEHLSPTIAYPVCTMFPGIVCSCWSVFVFHEIKGVRNLVLLCTAYTITLGGVLLVALSKEVTM